jgi:hypothetical protein
MTFKLSKRADANQLAMALARTNRGRGLSVNDTRTVLDSVNDIVLSFSNAKSTC